MHMAILEPELHQRCESTGKVLSDASGKIRCKTISNRDGSSSKSGNDRRA